MPWFYYTAAALLGSILLALVSTWLLWKLEETGDEWILDAEDRAKLPEDWDVWRQTGVGAPGRPGTRSRALRSS
jgi:hypothetical protein